MTKRWELQCRRQGEWVNYYSLYPIVTQSYSHARENTDANGEVGDNNVPSLSIRTKKNTENRSALLMPAYLRRVFNKQSNSKKRKGKVYYTKDLVVGMNRFWFICWKFHHRVCRSAVVPLPCVPDTLLRPMVEDVSAFSQQRKFLPQARKTSATQGIAHCLLLSFLYRVTCG